MGALCVGIDDDERCVVAQAFLELLGMFPDLGAFLLSIIETGQIRIPASLILVYFKWATIVPASPNCTTNCSFSIQADTQWFVLPSRLRNICFLREEYANGVYL